MPGPAEHPKTTQSSRLPNFQTQAPDVVQEPPERYRNQSAEERLEPNVRLKEQPLSKQSTGVQSILPLQWIDEQELRQNKSGLRKTIRSYARRDTCLRQQRLNAASKSRSKAPRSFIEKSGPNNQVPPSRSFQTKPPPQTETQPPERCSIPQTGKCYPGHFGMWAINVQR
jgi:hypothetical protein